MTRRRYPDRRLPKGRIPRVPEHSHPLVRRMVEEMIARGESYCGLSQRSGLSFTTIHNWTTHVMPSVHNLEAALNALDLELVAQPRRGSKIVGEILHGEGALR